MLNIHPFIVIVKWCFDFQDTDPVFSQQQLRMKIRKKFNLAGSLIKEEGFQNFENKFQKNTYQS